MFLVVQMLHCFSLASGLKINLQKSNLLGVGVTGSLVNEAAASIGCSVMKAPFKYLGVMVGGNISKINAWDDMVGKIKSRLSKWKINTLFIGGHLTLLKAVLGSTPIYPMSLYKVPKAVLHEMESLHSNFFNGVQGVDRKISWVKWTKVPASKKYGGLGVSNFYALNRALLFRWVWRFLSHDNSLWFRFISAMHGSSFQTRSSFHCSNWLSIIRSAFKLQGCRLENKRMFSAVKMQGEINSSFRCHVRGGVESHQLKNIQDLVRSKVLSSVDDRWAWDLNGDVDFCVKDAHDLVDEVLLLKENVATRWIKTIPIKFYIGIGIDIDIGIGIGIDIGVCIYLGDFDYASFVMCSISGINRCVWFPGYTSALQIADVFGSAWFRMILLGYTSALHIADVCVWLSGYTFALQIADMFSFGFALVGLYALVRIASD
ncbi:hypothetical protein Tco_0246517 [Tanacetum coccineum]